MTPSAIRLDVLVELIRGESFFLVGQISDYILPENTVSNNPQTFHQALLLMASLSRLAPDSVLHNVMPVFTFMGSNVFHRDDSYSFRVVQKVSPKSGSFGCTWLILCQTIDSIVPVMASSLKKAHTDRLALYIGSRDFLRIFTDAANHIPRHRRIKFVISYYSPDIPFIVPQLFRTPCRRTWARRLFNPCFDASPGESCNPCRSTNCRRLSKHLRSSNIHSPTPLDDDTNFCALINHFELVHRD
jgi:hypothetical protein